MGYYAFAAFFNFITSIVIGSFILLSDRKNKVNFTFSLFAFSVAFWSFGYYIWQISNNEASALLWSRILMIGAVYIPITYFHFVCSFLGLEKKRFIAWSYLLFSTFLFLDFTPFLVSRVEPYLGFNFWPVAGPVFGVFLLVWYSYVFYATLLLFTEFKKSEGTRRSQIKFLLFGIAFGFICGSTNFFMWYRIPFPPIFNILVSAYVAATAYSIVRFKSFDIKLIGAQVLVWGLVLIIGSEFLFVTDETNRILIAITLIFSGTIGLLLIRSVKKEVFLREELQAANVGQANLIHIMNHQVKGHLGINKNIFAELMTNDYGKIPERAKPLIQKGLEESDLGVQYVTTVLRGASAENGTLPYDMDNMDFKTLVSNIVEKQKVFADKKGLTLNFYIDDGKYNIIGDVTQLGEAVKNLIDNSINYTLKGTIWVTLINKNNKILFVIKDTGVGIKEEDKAKIFRAGGVSDDSIKININSSGYGLAFVKGVIEAHKGKIRFESMGAGLGSTFFVELPIA